jgi:hypothetical protein
MNYFAHGRHFVSQPYVLAGTAIPDWLRVVDGRVRVRDKMARRFIDDPSTSVAAVARGIVRHHEDDAWFHRTPAFAELSWSLTERVRSVLAADVGLRPSFLGHILVELLLDAELIAQNPTGLDAYYRAVDALDAELVGAAVNRMAPHATDRLALWIRRFVAERFLYDYLDDAKLLFRLNQIMSRVRLPTLPDAFGQILPEARHVVRERQRELLRPSRGEI